MHILMSNFDLHMTMILPEDISERISSFIAGGLHFPFIKKDELISLLYLFGRNNRIISHPEKVLAIAKKTVETLEYSIVNIGMVLNLFLIQNFRAIITYVDNYS